MKEMVGGCCVCSDERGWAENPLVYCDGQGCTVAVHQACYGIVTVPTGPWFCRKCESQERAARVPFIQRCELCPSKDGALKRTDNGGWAHVVCALYIPEVRFGNVTTMEPIVLQMIPQERFSKVCYICEDQKKGSRASMGACMQCNKSGCKQQFHVTCAQALGLLCEEAGNYLDNVKYCGYCQHHYSKLKKGGNVKTIPPYKPIPADNGSDSSPEKDSDVNVKLGASGKRKNSGKTAATSSGVRTSASGKIGGQSPESQVTSAGSVIEVAGENGKGNSPSVGKDGSNSATTLTGNNSSGPTKFTTSNFVETVVTQSESVFGTDTPPQVQRAVSSQQPPIVGSKKRKSGGSRTPTNGLNFENSCESNSVNCVNLSTSGCPTNPSASIIASSTHSEGAIMVTDSKKMKLEPGVPASSVPSTLQSPTESVISNVNTRTTLVPSTNVITAITCTGSASSTPTSSIVVSVPLAATSLQSSVPTPQPTVVTSAPTLFQQLQQSVLANNAAMGITTNTTDAALATLSLPEEQPSKRPRSQSSEKSDKNRKQKRGAATSSNPTAVTSSTSLPAAASSNKKNGRGNANTENSPTPPPMSTSSQPATATTVLVKELKESPPSSPGSESISSVSQSGPRKSKNKRASNGRDEKDVKLFQNGVNAPHMLGNQLNPASMMAQKMSDTLSAELEAHSIFDSTNASSSTLVGPQLHSRVIASVRGNTSNQQPGGSSATTPTASTGGNGGGGGNNGAGTNGGGSNSSVAAGNIPQNLEQLLERQWEQGSQFLMEQAQHFDIASLLSCLHQLRAENLRLEEHVNGLVQRRDHLLAVNARLAIPLTSQPATHVNNVHPNAGLPPHSQHQQDPNRGTRINNSYLPHPMENGLPPDPSPPTSMGYPHQHRSPITAAGVPTGPVTGAQPSPTIRQSPAGSGYMLSQSPLNPPSSNSNIVSSNSATPGVVRSTSATPDSMRNTENRRSSQQSNYVYQVVSSAASSHPSSQVPVVTTQQMVIRRDSSDLHHQMSSSKPS